MRRKAFLLLTGLLFFIQYGCKKGGPDHDPDNRELVAPTEIQVSVQQNNSKAIVSGKADASVTVSLRYAGTRGAVLREGRTDAQGGFSLDVPLLRGYVQELLVYTSKEVNGDTKTSPETKVESIPAREAPLGLTSIQVKERLTAHRWKSDQNTSRILVKQTSPTPPYDMFVTTAQKFFDFKADGAFYFTVTSPLQFTDDKGNWIIDDQQLLSISTAIPLGPMQLNNIRIQDLSGNTFSFVTDIADGVFLIGLANE